ncbi:BatA domain-containing protein [Maribacter ulvicola]|uniref:N-terminal double-transmembrane domain-containing protein n=1 Tax=Maribacter ulvicola TaxID=228959 RepID=A0A1N6Z5K2_9FLAO|nr:BatA domain-containing protein [Maribacter ulvicola]SIR22104.1 N-terminal double-transmembrane domain-containing protein [Maribacter ulvicola]
MSFAQPSYLWALLGLLVPIAIHLWSKQEAKTIKIGSVQLLSESKSKQSSSIQLNEWWLLVLRMGIISLLVLLLAKPQWQTKVKNSELTYIMEPELVRNENFMSRFNALNESQEIRLLKKDLPVRNEDEQIAKTSAVQDYWALASEMDGLNTDSIVVFTTGFASGLKGARPETKKKINWIVIDSALSKNHPLLAYKKDDGFQLYTAWSTPDATKITSKTITLGEEYALSSGGDSLVISRFNPAQKVPVVNQNTIEVSLFYSDSLGVDKTYLEASLKALSMYLDKEIKVASQLDTEIDEDKEADVIIWLSAKPHPETTQKLLVWKEDTKAQSIIIAGEDDNTYYLTKRINPENAVYERLTEKLLEVLNVNQEVEELLAEVDHRSVTTSELETMYVANDKKEKQLASWNVNPYLWLMLLILLLVERFVAYKRKQ